MNPQIIVKSILENKNFKPAYAEGAAFAPANIALIKYWGKRDLELNLPVTSSLSVSLGNKGAFTKIKLCKTRDCYLLNGEKIAANIQFAKRLKNFLDLFRPSPKIYYQIETELNLPIAAGLASSACGFAALVQALNNLYDWQLDKSKLSILARLGSGSACRSLMHGFVEWQAGTRTDGMDSFGVPLPYLWQDLRLGLLIFSAREKKISSREAMWRTAHTSPLYAAWPEQVSIDLHNLKQAILEQDFELFGKTAEANAVMMHEMMLTADPPINYFLPETHAAIQTISEIRKAGALVFFTQDAGPNLQLLFLAQETDLIKDFFPDVEIIAPFHPAEQERVILVDTKDQEIGSMEKMQAHKEGKLHRAFSVFVLREKGNKIEVLMQKRHADKYHSGGLWTNTCCGHPRPKENIVVAAERRLQEEMGFTTQLKPVGSFCYKVKFNNELTEHELDHVLIGTTNLENPPYNPEEVQNTGWLALDLLKEDLTLHPQKYTPWLAPALELLLKHGHSQPKRTTGKKS